MLFARLVCSDPECAAIAVGHAETLAELESLACDCGCGLVLLAWPREGALSPGGRPDLLTAA